MALCVLALIVFSIMGIFSGYYRQLAKEAFLCVFTKASGKRCQAELDTKIKGKIAGKLGKVSPNLSRIVLRHFAIFSYAFFFIFLITTIYLIIGGVNFYLYGNCNGLDSTGFCVFDPTGSNMQGSLLDESGELICLQTITGVSTLSNLNTSLFNSNHQADQESEYYFFGSYSCPYTQAMYADFSSSVNTRNANVRFVMVETHNNSLFNKALACIDETRVMEYNDLLFNSIDRIYDRSENKYNEEEFFNLLRENNFNVSEIMSCIESSQELYQMQGENLKEIALGATPTLYVPEDDLIVRGPRPKRVYMRILK